MSSWFPELYDTLIPLYVGKAEDLNLVRPAAL